MLVSTQNVVTLDYTVHTLLVGLQDTMTSCACEYTECRVTLNYTVHTLLVGLQDTVTSCACEYTECRVTLDYTVHTLVVGAGASKPQLAAAALYGNLSVIDTRRVSSHVPYTSTPWSRLSPTTTSSFILCELDAL